ncbi:hypothetical protein ACT2CR_00370 [Candidatus Vidania fulgoroideorum]
MIKLINKNKKLLKIISLEEAKKEAINKKKDLIKIAENVYIIDNKQKFFFNKKKRKKNNNKKTIIKILKFKTNTFSQDFYIKIKKIITFIKNKFIVKIFLINKTRNKNSIFLFKNIIKNLKKFNIRKEFQKISNNFLLYLFPK